MATGKPTQPCVRLLGYLLWQDHYAGNERVSQGLKNLWISAFVTVKSSLLVCFPRFLVCTRCQLY
jgi:hypothetical protein